MIAAGFLAYDHARPLSGGCKREPCLLVVDDDASGYQGALEALGTFFEIVRVQSCGQGREAMRNRPIDVVILESQLRDGCGLMLFEEIQHIQPTLPVIMATRFGSEAVCAAAFRLGVKDYFSKPVNAVAFANRVLRSLPAFDAFDLPRGAMASTDRVIDIGRLVDPRVRRAVQYIHEHCEKKLSLPEVARSAAMGQFTLSRAFAAVMQMPFRRYVLQVRIARVKELLAGSGDTVTEICAAAGFGDLSRFNKVFRKYVGMTPTAYRRIVRREVPSRGVATCSVVRDAYSYERVPTRKRCNAVTSAGR